MQNNHLSAYLDLAFLGGLLIHMVILWVTTKLAHLPVRWNRIWAGSIFAALYSLIIFFPDLSVLTTISVKIIISILIILITFGFIPITNFLRVLGYYFACSFVFGEAINFLKRNPNVVNKLSGPLKIIVDYPTYIIIVILLIIILIKGSPNLIGNWIQKQYLVHFSVPLTLRLGMQTSHLTALIDSSNNLRDSLTQTPVIVIEYNALQDLLPEEIKINLKTTQQEELDKIKSSDGLNQFKLISFSYSNKLEGTLIGFIPDEIIITQGEKSVRANNVIVGIYNKQISTDGTYQAIAHPDIIETSTPI